MKTSRRRMVDVQLSDIVVRMWSPRQAGRQRPSVTQRFAPASTSSQSEPFLQRNARSANHRILSARVFCPSLCLSVTFISIKTTAKNTTITVKIFTALFPRSVLSVFSVFPFFDALFPRFPFFFLLVLFYFLCFFLLCFLVVFLHVFVSIFLSLCWIILSLFYFHVF